MDFLLNHANSYWFGLAAFLIFAAIFSKLVIGPIVKALDAREAKIKGELEESEATFNKAKEMQADLDKQLKGAEAKIAEMMAEARRDGEEQKKALAEQGRAEIDEMRTKALREIDAAPRHAAIVALREEFAEVATGIAEKIVKKELDGGQYQSLVPTIEAIQSCSGEFN